MYILHHFVLCPFSRKIRVVLNEKNIAYTLKEEKFWERKKEFLKLNPAMQVPVLVERKDNNYFILSNSHAIYQYLEEKHPKSPLNEASPQKKALNLQISLWFDEKLFNEVTKYLLQEKIINFYTKNITPSSKIIRLAKHNLILHMEYIKLLTRNHDYLAGKNFSMTDISAASQISIIDYFGEIEWQKYPEVKQWYSLIKSRPGFRVLLKDSVVGFNPPEYYTNPDF